MIIDINLPLVNPAPPSMFTTNTKTQASAEL